MKTMFGVLQVITAIGAVIAGWLIPISAVVTIIVEIIGGNTSVLAILGSTVMTMLGLVAILLTLVALTAVFSILAKRG